jgi:hypothetical protein
MLRYPVRSQGATALSGQRTPKSRARDALVGSGIAAVVILAATFGELGPARHPQQPIAFGAMQGTVGHTLLKNKHFNWRAHNVHPGPH